MSDYPKDTPDYVIIEDGLFCLYSECKTCKNGPRTKVIISYTPSMDQNKNHLIRSKCIVCLDEEIMRFSDLGNKRTTTK